MKNKKLQTIVLWILQILLGLLFLAAGSGKFTASELWQQKFANWGYPDNVYLFVGAVEMVGAVLLFIPRFVKYSAIFLVTIMLSAAMTHLFNQEAAEIIRPGIFIVFLSVLIYFKHKSNIIVHD